MSAIKPLPPLYTREDYIGTKTALSASLRRLDRDLNLIPMTFLSLSTSFPAGERICSMVGRIR